MIFPDIKFTVICMSVTSDETLIPQGIVSDL